MTNPHNFGYHDDYWRTASAASDAMAYAPTDDETVRRVPWFIAAVGLTGLAAGAYVVWLVIVAFARAAAGVS